MAENLERVQLGVEEEEQITGGRLQYRYYKEGYKIFSPKDPGNVYTFTRYFNQDEIIAIKDYEIFECKGMSDAQVLQEFVNKGWIVHV